ncbi:YfbK domain-containing protein [Flavivirga spongiicola]|uniref:von Willebrand factor type A domain-containing protein n=1 Tax=Flavivirga spongiicola TaxID=421621 RepID=A0ABU7XZT7_9FLAO|nr:von Willebrand factor type A domain-containing protein [Flavivirga sp. MEBiC05379]MDO5980374.1 von Willebrand factor type A domain-containing protein [Flavivirga sp. MEBiC05379]
MKALLKIIIVLAISIQVQAQERLISGKVTSASDNLPLAGANILIKGTSKGVVANFDGLYQIKAKPTDILVFNYVGFVTQEKKVGNLNTISIALQEDVSRLEEVVVTGYAVQRRSAVTGSVSAVKAYSPSASQIKRQKQKAYHNKLASQIQSNSLSKALQGQVAGVNVTSNSGVPSTNSQIRIRGISSLSGNKEPLVVIDDVVAPYKELEEINSKSIKAIDVLKGTASKTIYGSRGANGVILISTKNNKTNKEKELLYIVDGVPIKKENNHIIESLRESDINSKKEYDKSDAKTKFGKIAKNGCIVITTHQGNFRINNNESYAVIEENSFERTSLSPLSTFSIDVDKASYSNIRRMINNGETIEPDAVKIEEMVNYFDYNYPQPTDEHPFSINTEVAKTPWHNDTKIVKIGLQGKTYANEELPPSNLTFLLDVSGSMSSQNKLPLLKSAFRLLVNQLREQDKVSIVVYAGAAGVVLEPTSGKQKEKILSALNNLNSGGSTAGGAGIKLAYKLAEKHYKKNGNNRVILATDGDFNVGASSDKAMETLIEEKRKSGVFLSVLGFGYGNYKDSKLEILADKGNGNHAYIDNMQEAQKVFGKEFGGTLFTIAKDVKIQIEFNPNKVQAYRLIGYENRMLEDEDFIDDTKDAGELGSGHTVTALYEVIPNGVKSDYLKDVADLKYTKTKVAQNYADELFTVKFRYKKPDGDKSIEMVHVQKNTISEASEDLKFASAVALFGMQLRQSKYHNNSKTEDVIELAKQGRGNDKDGYRAEFMRLVSSYQNL